MPLGPLPLRRTYEASFRPNSFLLPCPYQRDCIEAMRFEVEFRNHQSLPIEMPIVDFRSISSNGTKWLENLNLKVGNQVESFGDCFKITELPSGNHLHGPELFFQGNFSNVHWIGARLSTGKVTVEGDVGDFLGSQMLGGQIVVRGNAGNWVGAENQGGKITIDGNCKDYLAGSLPGKEKGGNGATILVQGNAGDHTARRMRRGTISVAGSVGEGTCWQMLAGTVVIGGEIIGHLGGQMKRGTLICRQAPNKGFLPCFSKGVSAEQPIWRLIHQFLQAEWALPWLPSLETRFQCFHGDLMHDGRGEIWLAG